MLKSSFSFKPVTYSIFIILAAFIVSGVITGCNNGSASNTAGVSLVDDGQVPDSPKWSSNTPIDIQKISDKQYQVIIDWEPVNTNTLDVNKKNIIGYNVYRRKETTVDQKIATLDTTKHYYIDKSTDLLEGEKFFYTVSAFDNLMRESSHSDCQQAIIQAAKKTIPKPPANIFFAPGSQVMYGSDRGEILVSWDAPTQNIDNSSADDIAEYEVDSHAENNSTWVNIAKIPAIKNIFIDSNLTQGTYFYRVRAKNSCGNYSQYVDGNFTIYGKLDSVAPGQITNLEIGAQTGKNVLTWQNPKVDADGKTLDMKGVKIYRKLKGSSEPFALIKVMPADTTYTDFRIDYNSYYIYSLTAFDISGNESIMSKPVSSEAKAVYLDTPRNLYAKLGSDSTLTLNWDSVFGAAKYYIYRSELENGIYVKIAEVASNFSVMNIPYGKVYYYKVSAVDENGGEGSLSNGLQVIGSVLYKTIEAEAYLSDISKGLNAIARPFEVEVNVIDYLDSDQKGAYLKFMPVSTAQGEKMDGNPLVTKETAAVDDYFELNYFMTSGSYRCDLWIKKGPECGIYQVDVQGAKFGPIDCYSNNPREMLKLPITFIVEDDAVNHGKNVKIRFTCLGRGLNAANYNLNLDKIIVYK
ncbi:MAG: hypothetical protein QMC67_08070 [Candidatus Wallbacteria bacterium]